MGVRHDYDSRLGLLLLAQKEAIHDGYEHGEYSFLYMEPCVELGYDGE